MFKTRVVNNKKSQKLSETSVLSIEQFFFTTSSTSSYFGARYLDPRTSRWLSVDPAMYKGDYIPRAPINDEVRRNNNNLPGMGGIYNYVNMHVYHYGGNNPVVYIDPDGKIIVSFNAYYNMSNYTNQLLGNSSTSKISDYGCYITTFANIGVEMFLHQYPGFQYGYSSKHFLLRINSLSEIFQKDSGLLHKFYAMDVIFGEGRWDYWTKDVQVNNGGLLARLNEYHESEERFFIVGIFDISSLVDGATTHMVGLTGLPNTEGYFDVSNIVPSSRADIYRLSDDRRLVYNMDNLVEIRVIMLD